MCQAHWEEAEWWKPAPACTTPKLCSAPNAEYCTHCWGSWNASELERGSVSWWDGVDYAMAAELSKVKVDLQLVEHKRRQPGRPKNTPAMDQVQRNEAVLTFRF